jgi:hypothetical protein
MVPHFEFIVVIWELHETFAILVVGSWKFELVICERQSLTIVYYCFVAFDK